MKKLNGNLSITRPMFSDGHKAIVIRIQDENSRAQFVELEVNYENFVEALTGFANVPCNMEVRGLSVVGKIRERDRITFPIPECGYKERDEVAYREALKHTPDGWQPSSHFRSRDSFYTDNEGRRMARCGIYRYVEPEA